MRRNKVSILFIVFKYKVKLIIPEKYWQLIYKITFKKYFDNKFYQEIKYYKSKSKSKFYIIRRRPPGAGLFSNVFHVIQGILRAESISIDTQLLPIVDFENYYMGEIHSLKDFPAKSNSWTNYFLQLSPYELDDVYKNYDYILSSEKFSNDPFLLKKDLNWIFDDIKFNAVTKIIKEYINPNLLLQEMIINWKDRINWDPKKTLALGVRGGSYVKYRHTGHPVQASVDEVIPEVEKYLERYTIEKIYLQTHDYKIYDDVKRRFGEKILKSYSMSPYNSLEEFSKKSPKDRPYHWDKVPRLSYEENYRYLIDVYMMSDANFLIASLTNGTAFTIANNGKRFSDLKILNKGYYE